MSHLKGGFKEWVDGWVAEWVDVWKVDNILGRFDTYKGWICEGRSIGFVKRRSIGYLQGRSIAFCEREEYCI